MKKAVLGVMGAIVAAGSISVAAQWGKSARPLDRDNAQAAADGVDREALRASALPDTGLARSDGEA